MSPIPYGKQTIEQDDIEAVLATLTSDFLTTGPHVHTFEESLAHYVNAPYCVVVSNATAALHLVSLSLLQKGDKVLTTPNSFLATSNALLYVGAIPIFVDIDDNGNINLDLCEEYLKKDPSIKALFCVHFSGNPLSQARLLSLKEQYSLIIVEDGAHALGAYDELGKIGSCQGSDCTIFSFHPVKLITTAEGGAITTHSDSLYQKLLTLRSHGMVRRLDIAPWYYEMHSLGFNYRLTDIQCALGESQLTKLDTFISQRHQLAQRYDKSFSNTSLRPLYPFTSQSAYHLYCVRYNFENAPLTKIELFEKFRENDIFLQLHYIPINQQPYYMNLGYNPLDTPMMQRYYHEVFSLPLYPTLQSHEQDRVISLVHELLI